MRIIEIIRQVLSVTHLSVIQAEACAGSNIYSRAHGSSIESESEGLLGS